MEPNWVQLCNCSSPQKAQIIKGLLNENEISAVILNKQDSSYLFGEHEIFVSADNIIRAKHLLSQTEITPE